MILTEQQLAKCLPKHKDIGGLLAVINATLILYEIKSEQEVAAFLAQCGHESIDFTTFEENMNYSAAGLRKTWPKRFPTDAIAQEYARKPERIANKVYANRMGNGDETSGDGWKYHGRGAIQLTGKDNYEKFAAALMLSLPGTVEYIKTLQGSIEAACWFWTSNKLGEYVNDIEALTKKINGGLLGIEDRKDRFIRCLDALKNK